MSQSPRPRRRSRLADPRVWLGVGVTVVALWFAFRDIPLAELGQAIREANLWLLILPAVPAHFWALYVRALRWRYLAKGIGDIGRRPLLRATAVGFMANNVFPLRIGEVVRAWFLAREANVSATGLFVTVLLERLIDLVFVLGLAAVFLGPEAAERAGVDPSAVVLPLLAAVGGVVAFIVTLRIAPERVIGLALRLGTALLPERLAERLEHLLRQLAAGLSGLRSVGDFFWVTFHTCVLWLVCSVIPFLAALLALNVELGGVPQLLEASYITLVWVGAMVALPSAPGFFGPFHVACRFALTPLGVPKAQALALGTLVHGLFWVSMICFGLVALRSRGSGLEAAMASAEAEGSAAE